MANICKIIFRGGGVLHLRAKQVFIAIVIVIVIVILIIIIFYPFSFPFSFPLGGNM